MIKTLLVTSASLLFVYFVGFRVVENPIKQTADVGMPKEKREILNKIAGRWITATNIHKRNGQPASKVVGSDVYQWAPGGNFLLHFAYGLRDTASFGAMEVIGYDKDSGNFFSYNFNPDGSFSKDKLSVNNTLWVWNGKEVRSTGVLSEDGKTLKVKHEITSDGKTYELFMNGVLTRGSDF